MNNQRIADATRRNIARTGTRPGEQAYLSNGIDGTVIADQLNRLAWFYTEADNGRRSKDVAILLPGCGIPFDNISPDIRIPIKLGKPPNDDRLHIMGQDGTAATGGYTIEEMKINAAAHQAAADLQEFRVSAIGADVIEVRIEAGLYTQPSTGLKMRADTATTYDAATTLTDLQALLGANEHQIVWVCKNYETGAIVTAAGTATTASSTVPSPGEFVDSDITGITIPANCKPLIPVYLYDGQTAIEEVSPARDILRLWDARLDFPLNVASSGGSGAVDKIARVRSVFAL